MVGTSNLCYQSIHQHRDINSILIQIRVAECCCANGEFVKCFWVTCIVLYLFHISELLYLGPDFSFFDFGESMVLDLLVFIISLSELMEVKTGSTIAGLEDRLASLAIDSEDVDTMIKNSGTQAGGLTMQGNPPQGMVESSDSIVKRILPENAFAGDVTTAISTLPVLFNTLFVRRAIIPAANGHFSARALARYYAMLVTGGIIPPKSSSSEPPLGSLTPENKKFDPLAKKSKESKKEALETKIDISDTEGATSERPRKLYSNPRIHDAFLGSGEYSSLAYTAEKFGLGFRRITAAAAEGKVSSNNEIIGFGHSGVGGSTGFCLPGSNFAIAITVNKLSQGSATAEIVRLVTSELGLPCPAMYASVNADRGADMTGGLAVEN
jgi:aarF domain-containing kinase